MAFVRYQHADVGTWVEFDCPACHFDMDFTEPHQPAPAEGSVHVCAQCSAEEVVRIEDFVPVTLDIEIDGVDLATGPMWQVIEMMGVTTREHAMSLANHKRHCWVCGGDWGQC